MFINLQFDKILKLAPSEIFAQRPNYIFEVAYGNLSPAEVKWQAVKEGFNTMFAYHGSRLDNFHSIIYHGLQQHMNKVNYIKIQIDVICELN